LNIAPGCKIWALKALPILTNSYGMELLMEAQNTSKKYPEPPISGSDQDRQVLIQAAHQCETM